MLLFPPSAEVGGGVLGVGGGEQDPNLLQPNVPSVPYTVAYTIPQVPSSFETLSASLRRSHRTQMFSTHVETVK